MSLRSYMNAQLKAMGKTSKEAQKDAGKYKSIAAAKKAGSLYYTDKNGKVMAAVYAEDLKKSPPKPKPQPKPKPKTKVPSDPRLNMPKTKNTPSTGKEKRIAELKAEIRKLRTKIANARQRGTNDRRAEARIREIQGIIKRMNK